MCVLFIATYIVLETTPGSQGTLRECDERRHDSFFTSPLLEFWGTVIHKVVTYTSGPPPTKSWSHQANSQQVYEKCPTSLTIREIKTTMKYRLVPVRMATVNKTRDNKGWWGHREKEILVHCWWECKLVQPLWKMVWRFFKKLKTELPKDPAIPLLGIYPKEMKSRSQKRYLQPHVHCSIIYNSRDIEITLESIDRWTDKENVVCVYIHRHWNTIKS